MRVGILEFSEEKSTFLYRLYRRVRGKWHCEKDLDRVLTEEADVVCLSAHTNCTVVYNIAVPASLNKKSIKEVLWNELAVRLPVAQEKVCRFYRKCDNTHYIICATAREEFDTLIQLAEKRGVKFDMLIPRVLASSPDEILQVVSGEALPERFRPVRCRKLKLLYWLLLMPAVILLAGNVWIRYQDFSREFDRLQRIRKEWKAEQRNEQKKAEKLQAEQEIFSQLRSLKLDAPSVSPILSSLTACLPKTIWITNYSQNYDTVDLMLSAAQDEPGLYNQIGSNACYGIVNLRKSRGYNSTTSFFVKLKARHE